MRQLSPINELKRAINRKKDHLLRSSLSDEDICYSTYGTMALSVYGYYHQNQSTNSPSLREKFRKLRFLSRFCNGITKVKTSWSASITLADLTKLKAKLYPYTMSPLNKPRRDYSYTQEYTYDYLGDREPTYETA